MTSQTKISDLFQISGRFLRSVHLVRDFNDPDILKEYILSDYSGNCLRRISKDLESASGQRAWRITGDYGTGNPVLHCFWRTGSRVALMITRLIQDNVQIIPCGVRQGFRIMRFKRVVYGFSRQKDQPAERYILFAESGVLRLACHLRLACQGSLSRGI